MDDTISTPLDHAPVAQVDIIGGTRAFIVWLGGAVAGITAMFYACGCLVTRAHLSLLGLYGLIDFSNDYILQEGAKFFLVTVYSTGREIFQPLSNLFPLMIALVLLGVLLFNRVRRRGERLSYPSDRLECARKNGIFVAGATSPKACPARR